MITYQEIMAKQSRQKREYAEMKECRAFWKQIKELRALGKAPNLIHAAHIPNEGKGNEKLVSMGLLPGFPDYEFVYKSRYAFADIATIAYIEFKTPGKKLSPEQAAFNLRCVQHGIPFLLAYDTRTAVEWLIGLGVIEG